MENNTVTHAQNPMVRMGLGVVFLFIAGGVATVFPPALILVAFFMTALFLEMFLPKVERDKMPYFNGLFVGPVKVAISMFMIGFIYLIENHFWGQLWIGVTLIFLYSGFKDMHRAKLTLETRQAESGHVQTVTEPQTAKQRTKAEKEDARLLADLASFLDNPEDTEDGKK